MLPYLASESGFLPKSSNLLINNFIYDILTLRSNLRNLVILSHLYFENIIDGLIEKNFKNPQAFDNFNFYNKIKVLESQKVLDDDIMKYLLFVNNIRNKFAHNLDYDIPDSQLMDIQFFSLVCNRFNYKIRKYRMKRNYNMFAAGCIDIILRIIEDYPEISRLRK
jgi:uncharacterized protein YutE (UPF0331/DUF86 family)